MLRLKGHTLDRLSPEKRERMERTLQRMEEARRKDDMKLREVIKSKREWAVKERQKGFDIISKYDEQIEQIKEEQNKVKEQIKTLDGCLLVLDDLIMEIKNIDDAENKKAKQIEDKKKEEGITNLKEKSKKTTKKIKSKEAYKKKDEK